MVSWLCDFFTYYTCYILLIHITYWHHVWNMHTVLVYFQKKQKSCNENVFKYLFWLHSLLLISYHLDILHLFTIVILFHGIKVHLINWSQNIRSVHQGMSSKRLSYYLKRKFIAIFTYSHIISAFQKLLEGFHSWRLTFFLMSMTSLKCLS